ncbi:MAG: histidine kinase N-terminal 7TM domain-containing protein [Bacillota bacterium]|nr:histidine kinase N-terminal 7TM domain-containing protein [Bacillota bacterium]
MESFGSSAIISDVTLTIIIAAIIYITALLFRSRDLENPRLIHKLYFIVSYLSLLWLLLLVAMRFVAPGNTTLLQTLDALMYISAAFLPVFALLIALVFVYSWERLPRYLRLLFIVPGSTVLVALTNPLHHLMYREFSLINIQADFGPYIYVNGAYSYGSLVIATALLFRFAWKSKNRLYTQQVILLSLGNLTPMLISFLATFGLMETSVAATPMAFVVTILFTGIAISKLHLLDIRPIAIQHVLDSISDCYLILSDKGLVISYNEPFRRVFGLRYGIAERVSLQECVKEEDIEHKTPIYNLLISLTSCQETGAVVSYEEGIGMDGPEGYAKFYYVVDITPLTLSQQLSGYVVMFKDITQVKKSMQQLQESQSRLIEQERLAFLGQMAGGLAHNLKTPIMSISGCGSAIENLIQECEQSIGDPEVTREDYAEIFEEMREWLNRASDACFYMSEIISTIKGQAANVTTSSAASFSLSDLIKRSALLVRHELQSGKCYLSTENKLEEEALLQGDINNLIQVLNNLLSNAIYAQSQVGGGVITIGSELSDTELLVYVRDTGPGIEPRVKEKLFREMTTSKGSQGTGLGLYISNAVIRGKFGGSMWARDNPEGGTIIGFSIPRSAVELKPLSKSKKNTGGNKQ